MSMRYLDYVDINYRPRSTDLICSFKIKPKNVSIREAAGEIAAESSTGTWTEVTTTTPVVRKLGAHVFSIKKDVASIAYHDTLFEKGNMPSILSSIAGNIFGMKMLSGLRLEDIYFPLSLVKGFHGPKFGIKGIRKILKVRKRPLVGTIVKPKLGLDSGKHAKIAYEAWVGGCDIVKDDENLSSQSFNLFRKRVMQTLKMRDMAEKETGERKVYMANVTAETNEMIRRARFVKERGGEYAMVDIITCGWAALQTLREAELELVLHAHRAGHAALTKLKHHGISMKVIAKISRLIGIDQLHVGTAVGKMSESREEVLENVRVLKEKMFNIKPVMPVASGGLHPGNVPAEVKIFGTDVIIQMGGGIHGHPKGTRAGATAARQAIDAVLSGISLKEYAKKHEELRIVLKKWK